MDAVNQYNRVYELASRLYEHRLDDDSNWSIEDKARLAVTDALTFEQAWRKESTITFEDAPTD